MGVHIWGSKDAVIAGTLTVGAVIASGAITATSGAFSSFVSAGASPAGAGHIRLPATASMYAKVGAGDVPVFDIGGGALLFGGLGWTGGVYFDAPDAVGIFFRSARHAFFNAGAGAVKPTVAGTIITATNGTAANNAYAALAGLNLITDTTTDV